MAFPADYTLLASIVIDADQVSGSSNHSNFPILITEATFPDDGTRAGVFGSTDNGGGDVRFSSDEAGSNQLSCEIVSWNTATNICQVWVKIPTLAYDTDTTIYIWGDNTGDSQPARNAAFGSDDVWSNGFQLVLHFEGNYNDSSANQYNLSDGTAPEAVSGKIGNAYQFDRTNSEYIIIADASCPNLEIASNNTYSIWLKPISAASGINQYYLGKVNSTPNIFHSLNMHQNTLDYGCVHTGLSDTNVRQDTSGQAATDVAAGTWILLTGVFDDTNNTHSCYRNGAGTTETSITGTCTDSNASFAVGRGGDFSGNYADAVIDEVRVANVARSSDWVITEYNNQNTPGTFATAVLATPAGSSFIPRIITY